jgi:hypothetical protein
MRRRVGRDYWIEGPEVVPERNAQIEANRERLAGLPENAVIVGLW